ncbi:hypothetical protein [Adlercreutzia sp. ZJ305]|uniref:hypothetical protein n=1 Tax=Adlercreutzia sp. ZJ305 TaxID=2709408 RepID=UPI0013EB73EA|nr:hypothetical protein [Adlercreutzia sp. ZJ305]
MSHVVEVRQPIQKMCEWAARFAKYWKRTGKFGVAEIEKEIEDAQRFQNNML